MRIIDADAFEANMQNEWERNEISNGEWIHFREMINAEPTAEPERKTGRWIAKPLYLGSEAKIYTCSECKNPFWWDSMNYCPNCGAGMRKEVAG